MKYILLGIIQGLTEFLPISSSGHLVIFQHLFGIGENIAFDVVVHVATLLAVIIYFRKDILKLLDLKNNLLKWLIIATIPTGLMGFFFKDFFESLFSYPKAVGFSLLITAAVILLAEWAGKARRSEGNMNLLDAILIGIAQGCAIVPGISRSGATISAGLARNFRREFAARFSFLLFIPAMLGATLLQFKKITLAASTSAGLLNLILGFIAAFLSGLLAIQLLLSIIRRTSLRGFAYYCLAVGLLIIFLL